MDEKQTPTPIPATAAGQPPHHHPKPIGKIIVGGVILLLLVIIGVLAWQLSVCLDHDKKADADNKLLQQQVDGFKKQIEDAKKSSATPDSSPTTQCTNDVSPSLRENIADALGSKNTAALQGYMASSVNVVIAASEKGGNEAPADAVKSLEYTHNGIAPWSFSLPGAEIAAYQAGSYKQYFPTNAYVGKSKDNMIVSFGFDCSGKINMVFMAVNADLLN